MARGTVVRVCMCAFLAYDDVEVTPGPRLNLVIGPNGTGKSSLVAALVLGLGGVPSLLGRSSRLEHFVKDGYDEALLTVELFEPLDENTVICRRFDRSGHSVWQLNGRAVTLKHVQRVVDDLNIQVDNLCQMLPQERVQDFSRMEPTALLESTERAAGYDGMLEDHQLLARASEDDRQWQQKIDECRGDIEARGQKMAALQEAANHQLQKQKYERRLAEVQRQLEWLRYQAATEEHSSAQEAREVDVRRLAEAEARLAPLRQSLQRCESAITGYKVKLTAQTASATAAQKEADKERSTFEREEELLQRVDGEFERLLSAEQQRHARCEQLQQKLLYNRSQLDQLVVAQNLEDDQWEERAREVETRIRQLVSGMAEREEQRSSYRQRRQQLISSSERLTNQLHQLDNVVEQRLHLLRLQNQDVYKAVLWLRQNGQRFVGVSEPIVLLLDILKPQLARYLSACIPWRDMMAFTCDNKQVMDQFIEEVREHQQLRISCLYVDPKLAHRQFSCTHPRDLLQKVGFTHTVDELFNCVPIVRGYLLATYNLHNVPVANVADSQAPAIVKAVQTHGLRLRTFMIGSTRYRVRQSFYSKHEVMVSESLRPVNEILTKSADREAVAKVREQIAEVKHMLEQVECDGAAISDDKEDTIELDRLRREKKATADVRAQISRLQLKVSITEASLNECRSAALDVDRERAATIAHKQSKLESLLATVKRYVRVCERALAALSGAPVTRAQLNSVREHRAELRTTLSERQTELNSLRDALRTSTTRRDRCEQVMVAQRERALSMLSVSSERDALKALGWDRRGGGAAADKIPSLADIEELVRDCEARVEMMRRGDEDEDGGEAGCLAEYTRLQAERDRLHVLLTEYQAEQDSVRQRCKECGHRWFTAVLQLVKDMSRYFSEFFRRLDCAGEVVLTQQRRSGSTRGSNNNSNSDTNLDQMPADVTAIDVAQLGVSVRVQYRSTEPLRELSAMHHSGGERSVATMVYIVSLQMLSGSGVPFRCVDEVNQGMDEANERRMFEFVVSAVSDSMHAQYFLITPKLLAGLSYPETATVLCVFNSPSMISHKYFSVETCLRAERKRKRSSC